MCSINKPLGANTTDQHEPFSVSYKQFFNIQPEDQFYHEDTQIYNDLSLERTPKYDTIRVLKPQHGFTRNHNAESLDQIIQRNSKQKADSGTDVQSACSILTSHMESSAKNKREEDIQELYEKDTFKRIYPVINNASLINRSTYDHFAKKDENKDVKGSRQTMSCKVIGQTKHFTLQKPVYSIPLQDKHLIEYMSHKDIVRHAMHAYFDNDEKSNFSSPSVTIPPMHPLLSYKLRYLNEKSDTTSDHNVETQLVTRL
ncbi:unnamed protein product [Mytilus coruscus]|uniref:Uncharacterized protein n=1 Tax=Mytilus coruscus TaxID=42192 RepID=A0A6J8AB88_MYTCO|nr:unnamed protein product [Mytilus coruscus]